MPYAGALSFGFLVWLVLLLRAGEGPWTRRLLDLVQPATQQRARATTGWPERGITAAETVGVLVLLGGGLARWLT